MDFTDWLYAQGFADRTVAEYDKWARRWQRWCWAHDTDPTHAPIGLLVAWAQTIPPSWASRKQAHTALGHLHTYLGRDDDAHHAIRIPAKPSTSTRALPDADAHRLHQGAVLYGGREGAAVLLGLYTGARRLEIARFAWAGVDFDRGRIRWTRAKGGGTADMLLHPELEKALVRLPRSGDHLFPGNNGRAHVTPATVWNWVRKVARTVGVQVRTHELRASWITELTDNVGLLEAAELAGHKDPRVTMHYVKGRQETKDAAVAGVTYCGRRPAPRPHAPRGLDFSAAARRAG